jgi:hypothetical protein
MQILPLLAAIAFVGRLCLAQVPVWKSPSPSPAQAATLLQSICPRSAQPADSKTPGSLPGCKSCPDFTTDGALQPGLAIHDYFGIQTIIQGSFTAPGAVEAVASFKGCEPHAENYGGSILLAKSGDSWSIVRYVQALITTACRPYRLQNGRDLLLCDEQNRHPQESRQTISVIDLSNPKRAPGQSVFGVVNTSGANGPTAVWGSIDRATLADRNGDGTPDLTLEITVGQGACTTDGGSCLGDYSDAIIQKYTLDFLFHSDSGAFLPAPSSRATVDRLASFFKDGVDKALKPPNSTP